MSIYKKGSTDTVLDTINTENAITINPLSLNNVGFGVPQEVSTPGATQNARVRVYALMKQGYSGTVDIEYQRLSLEQYFENQTLLIQATGALRLSDLLTTINNTYATNFTKEDVVEVDLSTLGEDYIVTLAVSATCLMWSGSVDVRVTKNRPALSSIITNQKLDLVNAPFALTGQKRLEYVAWGYDFIEAQAELSKYINGAAATADLASVINAVVDLKLVFADAGSVAIGQINIKGATCYRVVADGFTTLEIRGIDNSEWTGTLIIPWIAG